MRYGHHMTLATALLSLVQPAASQELQTIKVATTFLGLWDTSQPTLCAERGEFKKAGLDVQVTSTRGGSENVQAVIAGGMDIGYSPGVNAVLAASMQGASIKVISAEFLGQNDSFFYVPADSPVKKIEDLAGKSVAFPRPGGAGEAILLGLKAERGIDFKPIATGALDATLTMTMSGQVDVGYSVPPSVLKEVKQGKVRVLFSGDDVASQRELTGRVVIANSDFVAKNRPAVETFMKVLDQCIDWAYANPDKSAEFYAKLNKIDADVAEKGMSFYKRQTLAFGPLKNLDKVVDHAASSGSIKEKPTKEQLEKLIDIVYTTPSK